MTGRGRLPRPAPADRDSPHRRCPPAPVERTLAGHPATRIMPHTMDTHIAVAHPAVASAALGFPWLTLASTRGGRAHGSTRRGSARTIAGVLAARPRAASLRIPAAGADANVFGGRRGCGGRDADAAPAWRAA